MKTRSRLCGARGPTSPAKISTLLAPLLVLVAGLATAIPRPQETPSRNLAPRLNIGKGYALLIGNQDYQHLTPLQTPVNDVRALGSVLESFYGFEVELLLDANRSQMIDAFDGLVERLVEADSLLIYYAGHGHQDDATGEGYWLPVTARSNRRSEWVANNTVRGTLKALSARHVLVVADSCFAGTLTRQASAGLPVGVTMDRYYQKLSNQKSRTALTSGGLEPVDDLGGGGHSVFAGALLDALQENPSPILEASKLLAEIKRPVMLGSSGMQQPLLADIRQTGHEDGEFLFFRTQSAPGLTVTTDPGQTDPMTPAPPDTAAGRACIDHWIHEVSRLLNAYQGDAGFNSRKPWRINRYGLFAATGLESVAAPDNWAAHGADRYRWMWAVYTTEVAYPSWNSANFDGARLPGLRMFVRQCLAGATD